MIRRKYNFVKKYIKNGKGNPYCHFLSPGVKLLDAGVTVRQAGGLSCAAICWARRLGWLGPKGPPAPPRGMGAYQARRANVQYRIRV